VSEPLHPGGPSSSGSQNISAAAQRAREQLREEFEQLRVDIGGLGTEQGGDDGPPPGTGFGRVRASLAVLALSAAVAAAAANFALNGGKTAKSGSVSLGPPSHEPPESGAIAAGLGGPESSFPVLSLIAPGLRTDTLGSSAGLPIAGPPFTGPSHVFVVGKPVPVGGHGSLAEGVAGANPVGHLPAPTTSPTPTPTPAAPAPEASQQLAYSPPPPPSAGGGGNPGGGNPGGGNPGGGNPGGGPGHGPGDKPEDSGSGHGASGGPGNGLGKGHIKGQGKGHDGGSPGNGHEKDPSGGETAQTGYGEDGSSDDPGGSAPAKSPSAAPAPPAEPSPPAEEHGKGHGKATAPGQLKK
jgi:hypothetical protein